MVLVGEHARMEKKINLLALRHNMEPLRHSCGIEKGLEIDVREGWVYVDYENDFLPFIT